MGFNCYIDESGDEGIETGGTRWFILGALIVPSSKDLTTSEIVSKIKMSLKRAKPPEQWTLHWSKIKKHDWKVFICEQLLTENWIFSCVVTDKKHSSIMSAAGLREKSKLYFYSTRLLVERLSWYARDNNNQKAHLIFEHRTTIDYKSMRAYFDLLKSSLGGDCKISWEHVDVNGLRILPKNHNRLLQACDCVCGALMEGLEPTPLGVTESRYIQTLRGRFYRRDGNLLSYGLKLLAGNKNEGGEVYPFVRNL